MSTTARATHPSRVVRKPQGQRRLAGAATLVIIGSFLPWVSTAVGNFSGARGAGLWTFYAAMLGLAGAIIPLRKVAIAQGALMAAAAIVLPLWQVWHLLRLTGVTGWLPGPGLVVVFGGGVLAASAVRLLLQQGRPSSDD